MKLGLDKHAISSSEGETSLSTGLQHRRRRGSRFMKTFHSKFLLFDWEFFSNELEFE
ncbi:MAG: hypothetical protein J0I09_01330 [Sphingobacteriia bacterium]|nr:hypothetical protein [Sphingobacteriia bacterium]